MRLMMLSSVTRMRYVLKYAASRPAAKFRYARVGALVVTAHRGTYTRLIIKLRPCTAVQTCEVQYTSGSQSMKTF